MMSSCIGMKLYPALALTGACSRTTRSVRGIMRALFCSGTGLRRTTYGRKKHYEEIGDGEGWMQPPSELSRSVEHASGLT